LNGSMEEQAMMRIPFLTMLLLAVPAGAVEAAPATKVGAPVVYEYVIGPEDVLDVSVWNNTMISRTVPVRPDGMISLPLLNDVRAAGQTPLELRDDLMKRLAKYMDDPEVSVIVREVHSKKVSVVGAVNRPGRFELKTDATVLDLLALAEGVDTFASTSRIVVLRKEGSVTRRLRFNYNKVKAGREQENFLLRPGDIIVVP